MVEFAVACKAGPAAGVLVGQELVVFIGTAAQARYAAKDLAGQGYSGVKVIQATLTHWDEYNRYLELLENR